MLDEELKSTTLSTCWQHPGWYKALSLSERATTWPALSQQEATIQAHPKGVRRLQSWKQQAPFREKTWFAERLSTNGLTEQDLQALLAESPTDLAERTTIIPNWLQTLQAAFQEADQQNDTEQIKFPEEIARDHALLPCLQAFSPLIKQQYALVKKHIQFLCQQYTALPFDPQTISQLILSMLPARLLMQIERTLVLEMHVEQIRHKLPGASPEERFQDFMERLCQTENMLALLEEYPVLARQCVLSTQYWAEYACEMLSHLCYDWHDICTLFTPHQHPGLLQEISGGVGDLHRKGRSVLILTFASGFRCVYKPKSLAIDVHFQELLAWLNQKGSQPQLGLTKIINRGNYGWSEFISASGCTQPAEIARFYERLGEQLALLYALNATDFHAENVIAAGEHPQLVDLEALFHPRIDGYDPTNASDVANHMLESSVMRVGLLPLRSWWSKENDGVDITGMGGQKEQLTPRAVPRWEAKGTDQMHIVRQRLNIPSKQNRPQLNQQEVAIQDYQSHIVHGFLTMYQLLQTVRNDLIEQFFPLFAQDEIRLLLRSTYTYNTFLLESFHPNLLRDALDRDRFFDLLWMEAEQRSLLAYTIAAEQRDLRQGDIPFFTTTAGSHCIYGSEGERLPIVFAASGLEIASKRLLGLDEANLNRQRWIIEASLASLTMGSEQMSERITSNVAPVDPVDHSRLINAAERIGQRLEELAMGDAHAVNWIGLFTINDRMWGLMPSDLDLYNGTSGIVLFLAYLGSITGEKRYTRLARHALATIHSQVAHQKKNIQAAGIGPFDGLGSAIYLYMHLGTLWNEPQLIQEAEALAGFLPPLIAQDEHLDVIGGSAGCILNLLNLYAIHTSQNTFTIAMQCGNRLLDTAQKMPTGLAWQTISHQTPPGGFSHGTTGIALSLLKLAAVSHEERFHQAALDALHYDQSLYLPDKANWQDVRNVSSDDPTASTPPISTMVAWCHGAAGIALGRMAALPYVDNAALQEEIAIALRTTMAEGLLQNHSLCHGSLGNLDAILMATQLFNDPTYREHLAHTTAAVVNHGESRGWLCGVPQGMETPGLMVGLAGIGYELLRLAEPGRVPSVLLLAPPIIR